jgi:hypothetical protein
MVIMDCSVHFRGWPRATHPTFLFCCRELAKNKRRVRNAHADSNARVNEPVIVVRDAYPAGTVPRRGGLGPGASYLARGNACRKTRMSTALQVDAFKIHRRS